MSKIIFMGTPEFAVGTLERLVKSGYDVVAVVTQPDKPVGRHHDTLQAPPVKVFAQAHGIPVMQPAKMKDPEFLAELRGYGADIFVVVAFRMLPEEVWAMPRYGTFNVHASLLPQYRGAAPINWAIINGETKTGVTTFFLDHNIDTGRIIMQKTLDIADTDDVEKVYDALMLLGADIAVETIDSIIANDGKPQTREQPSAETLLPAPKIFRETCQIDWRQPCKKVYDFVRGLSPYPGAWTELTSVNGSGASLNLKVFRTSKTSIPCAGAAPGSAVIQGRQFLVATTDFFLALETIQQQGKKRTEIKDFLNGYRK